MTQPYYPDRREVLKQIVTGGAAFVAGTTLVAQDGTLVPQSARDNFPPRQPMLPVTNTPPTFGSPPVASPQASTDQTYFRYGILEVPRYNRVVLPATERAVLTSLKTEQRDNDGNIIRDGEGNPTMIPIRKGMKVFEGQILGNFDDRELRSTLKINQAQLEVAQAERDKVIEKDFAREGVLVAKAEFNALEETNRKHERTVPAIEMKKAELAWSQAYANLELQTYTIDVIKTREVAVRESELERTNVQIDLRKLIAPIGGMITEINAAEGVWLREGDPVLEIMQFDILWVRKLYSALQYEIRDLLGKQVTVNVTLARGKVETFQGTVFFCDPTIQPGDTFDAYIEVENRLVGNYWLLQPGHRADIVLATGSL